MADLNKDLEELHAEVVRAVRERISNGGSNDDLRVALQLLKQNQVSAAAMPDTPTADLARMAGKLNFQTLEQKAKVVPLRKDEQLSA
jgi:hypothetical protein